MYVHYVVCDPEPQILNLQKSLAVCIEQGFVKFSSVEKRTPTVLEENAPTHTQVYFIIQLHKKKQQFSLSEYHS